MCRPPSFMATGSKLLVLNWEAREFEQSQQDLTCVLATGSGLLVLNGEAREFELGQLAGLHDKHYALATGSEQLYGFIVYTTGTTWWCHPISYPNRDKRFNLILSETAHKRFKSHACNIRLLNMCLSQSPRCSAHSQHTHPPNNYHVTPHLCNE